MIDSIDIKASNFKVHPDAEVKITPPSILTKGGKAELSEHSFEFRMGRKKYKAARVRDAVPPGETSMVHFGLDPGGLLVQVHSLPRFFNGLESIDAVPSKDFKGALEMVECWLADRGIEAELVRDAVPVRVDLFRNARLDFEFGTFYIPALRQSMAEGRSKMNVGEFGGETWQAGNTQRRTVLYDKQKQYSNVYGIDTVPENTVRAELKFIDKRSVQRHLGLRTMQGVVDMYDALGKIYNAKLEKAVLRSPEVPGVDPAKTIQGELVQLKNIYANEGYKAQRVVRSLGLKYLAENLTPSQAFDIFEEQFGRFAAARVRDDVEKFRLTWEKVAGRVPVSNLYNELRQKFLLAA